MKKRYDAIIIGSGIAGMTAAIYLNQAGKDICILESNAPGGKLLTTSTIRNYPACPNTDGPTLAINLYNQITSLNIPIHYEKVSSIEIIDDNLKKVITDKESYETFNIIIAIGREINKLNLANEEKLIGKGISYCATCDGGLYKNKNVSVIGAGNSAFKEALYLSNLCNSVTIIARSNKFRADDGVVNKVMNTDNVKILTNKTVEQLIGNEQLEELVLKDKITNEISTLKTDGCFIYIGSSPNLKMLKHLDILEQNGYLITDENMETTIKGIYACGDIRKKELYQLVTASYDGAIAANHITNNLNGDD